ncbi:MAG: sulfotransferase domain-containing protein [Deltaproteobacteria bacterium]|nr:sulfotransferase domain-containing protein [Deltaproteobacteria bacterium]
MATIQNTGFDKLHRHVRKKILVTFHGLAPSQLLGRFVGPKVLLNSIPKAGTHLLERALDQFPLIRNAGQKTLMAPQELENHILQKILSIKKGQFLNAHLQAHPLLLQKLSESDIKILLMIRDPRDVALSRVKYVVNIDRTHKTTHYLAGLKDDNERLEASIRGIPGILLPVHEIFERFAPWLEHPNVIICRFEDLVGESGGGNKNRQIQLVKKLILFLELEVEEKKIELIADKIFSPKSSTFNKGAIGGWKNIFNTNHKKMFLDTGREILELYGYGANGE